MPLWIESRQIVFEFWLGRTVRIGIIWIRRRPGVLQLFAALFRKSDARGYQRGILEILLLDDLLISRVSVVIVVGDVADQTIILKHAGDVESLILRRFDDAAAGHVAAECICKFPIVHPNLTWRPGSRPLPIRKRNLRS